MHPSLFEPALRGGVEGEECDESVSEFRTAFQEGADGGAADDSAPELWPLTAGAQRRHLRELWPSTRWPGRRAALWLLSAALLASAALVWGGPRGGALRSRVEAHVVEAEEPADGGAQAAASGAQVAAAPAAPAQVPAAPAQAFAARCPLVERDVAYTGTLGAVLDHIPDPEMCCAMCHGIPNCTGWVWVNADLEGEPHQCNVLTGQVSAKTPSPGAASGVPPQRPPRPLPQPVAGVEGQPASPDPAGTPAAAAPLAVAADPGAGQAAASTADSRASCARFGENCFLKGMCCQNETQRCYMKNPKWASCLESCEAGVHESDPKAARTAWACTDVDKGPPSVAAPGVVASPAPPPGYIARPVEMLPAPAYPDRPPVGPGRAGLELFCFSLIQAQGYEPRMLAMEHGLGTSIFACEEFSIYSSTVFQIVEGVYTEQVNSDLKCEFHEIAWNTNIFIAVWAKVIADGTFRARDWTVKVDADATFLPDRLRAALQDHPNAGYISNCHFGLHGPIEVFSRRAVEALAADYGRSVGGSRPETCVQRMPEAITGRAQWGEDMFVDKCLTEVLGVTGELDSRIMCEAHCDCPNWYWCANGTSRVTYHPFKREDMYRQCLANQLSGVSAA